jgi:hypothetical protein
MGRSLNNSSTTPAVKGVGKRRRPRRPLTQIVAAIKPASYRKRRAELRIDPPVGKELW